MLAHLPKRFQPLALFRKLRAVTAQTRTGLPPKPAGTRRILVVANGGIGNAVASTPLVQALRSLWPRAFLVFCGSRGDLFAGWGAVDRVVQAITEAQGLGPYDKTFVTFAATLGGLSSQELDQLGEIHKPEQALNRPFAKPEREFCLDLARSLGFTGPAPSLYVSLRQPALPLPSGRPLVCLLPGSKPDHRWRHKRWMGYAELCQRLVQRFPPLTILILGTEHDRVTESLLQVASAVDWRGKFSLAETAWLLQQADLVIGNDCGPMHIADAVLAEHIVLFGPTCELKNGPKNRGWPMRGQVPCRPCQFDLNLLDTCPRAVCMEQITPEAVFSRAEEILARRGF